MTAAGASGCFGLLQVAWTLIVAAATRPPGGPAVPAPALRTAGLSEASLGSAGVYRAARVPAVVARALSTPALHSTLCRRPRGAH